MNNIIFSGFTSMLKDYLFFLREGLSSFQNTGSICATSKWAADVLSHPLDIDRPGANIMELGAGTGAVTFEILKKLKPEDRLTICEINPKFMDKLRSSLENNPLYQQHQDRIEFFLGPIQEFETPLRFEILVTSLPFLNFNPDLVKSIFDKLESISTPDAIMTYYEYIGLRELGKRFSPAKRRERLKNVEVFFNDREPYTRLKKQAVWLNVLPITIHTVKVHRSLVDQNDRSLKLEGRNVQSENVNPEPQIERGAAFSA